MWFLQLLDGFSLFFKLKPSKILVVRGIGYNLFLEQIEPPLFNLTEPKGVKFK